MIPLYQSCYYVWACLPPTTYHHPTWKYLGHGSRHAVLCTENVQRWVEEVTPMVLLHTLILFRAVIGDWFRAIYSVRMRVLFSREAVTSVIEYILTLPELYCKSVVCCSLMHRWTFDLDFIVLECGVNEDVYISSTLPSANFGVMIFLRNVDNVTANDYCWLSSDL